MFYKLIKDRLNKSYDVYKNSFKVKLKKNTES